MRKTLLGSFILSIFIFGSATAGNPDRQGEAGAYELLMNPWARSSGVNGLNCSNVKGVEAMFINPAGLYSSNKTQVALSHTRWLVPSGINMNAFGIAQKVGKRGALGIGLCSVGFGDIPVTTTENPEGTGATYSPTFFNVSVGYAHNFADKVTVAIQLKGISEAIQDVSAFGFGIDAGVQYSGGEENQFKLGIAVRNIGGPMRYNGEGVATQLQSISGHNLTYDVRINRFELPSLLHIGTSYDLNYGEMISVTPMVNFTSNSFGRDELGIGAEARITDYFMVRASYKLELGKSDGLENSAYTGFSAGASLMAPLKKKSDSRFGVDYAYRPTSPFQGTHNIGIRLEF